MSDFSGMSAIVATRTFTGSFTLQGSSPKLQASNSSGAKLQSTLPGSRMQGTSTTILYAKITIPQTRTTPTAKPKDNSTAMPKARVSPVSAAVSKVKDVASSAWSSTTSAVDRFVGRVTSTPEFKGATAGCVDGASKAAAFAIGAAMAGGPKIGGAGIAGSCLLGACGGYFDAAFGGGAGSGFRAIDDGMTGYELYWHFLRR